MNKLYVGATGLVTPIGLGQQQTYCSVEAGINRYQESDVIGSLNEPVKMALVPNAALDNAIGKDSIIGKLSHYQKRLLKLATIALQDIQDQLPDEPLPLFLAGPQNINNNPSIDMNFIDNLSQQTSVEFDLSCCRVNNIGRSGAIDMMDMAERYFDATDAHYVLVGSVDSYYNMPVLKALNADKRLLLPNSVDGFVPGEAAAFTLFISPKAPPEIKAQAIATVSAIASNRSHRPKNDETPLCGDILNEVLQQTLEQVTTSIQTIYNTQNGESQPAKHFAIAMLRNTSSFSSNKKVIKPASCFGDIGAAFGGVLLALATQKSINSKNKSPILVCCSSDSPKHAAFCLTTDAIV